MTDSSVVFPYLIALAFFVVGMVVLFLVVKQAILSALAEDRRRTQQVVNAHAPE